MDTYRGEYLQSIDYYYCCEFAETWLTLRHPVRKQVAATFTFQRAEFSNNAA